MLIRFGYYSFLVMAVILLFVISNVFEVFFLRLRTLSYLSLTYTMNKSVFVFNLTMKSICPSWTRMLLTGLGLSGSQILIVPCFDEVAKNPFSSSIKLVIGLESTSLVIEVRLKFL